MTLLHARRSAPCRHAWTYFYPAAAALMMIKFAKYIKTGRGSRVAYVLYRDGFMEFASKSQNKFMLCDCSGAHVWCHSLLKAVTTSSIFGLMVELLQPVRIFLHLSPTDAFLTKYLAPLMTCLCTDRLAGSCSLLPSISSLRLRRSVARVCCSIFGTSCRSLITPQHRIGPILCGTAPRTVKGRSRSLARMGMAWEINTIGRSTDTLIISVQ